MSGNEELFPEGKISVLVNGFYYSPDMVAKLLKERDKMKDALEFYANDDNWMKEMWGRIASDSETDKDVGQKAREALK